MTHKEFAETNAGKSVKSGKITGRVVGYADDDTVNKIGPRVCVEVDAEFKVSRWRKGSAVWALTHFVIDESQVSNFSRFRVDHLHVFEEGVITSQADTVSTSAPAKAALKYEKKCGHPEYGDGWCHKCYSGEL